MIRSFLVFLLFFLMTIVKSYSQESYVQLAFEYFNKGEYEKAIEYYKELAKDEENLPTIYSKYLESYIKLSDEKGARQLLKKLTKKFPNNVVYEVDEIFLERNFGNQEAFNKQFDEFIDRYTKTEANLNDISNLLIRKREFELAEKLFLTARKNRKSEFAYVRQLLNVYRSSGNENGVIRESLNLLRLNPQNINYVQNILQSFITDQNYQKLESDLIRFMQKDSEGSFNEMLVWLYIQIKQFDLAFIQAKALDRRFDLMGSELLKLGQICYKNKDYNTAIEIYTYVIDKYPKSGNYAFARQKLIETREEIVKNTYPVDIEQIRILISDYSELLEELGKRKSTAQSLRKMALLYAFYLEEHDTAISILSEAVNIPRTPHSFNGLCKLSLGDIYILKDEPWESTLLYSQVDKSYKEEAIGHEAKLKLAKLYFYKGDFELAQANLDILKLATSREISNDAMDLSLLIQDNLALDTTAEALSEYAKIELLKFQQQFVKALGRYEDMLVAFPGHSLIDEIYWSMAAINLEMGSFEESVKNLDAIINYHANDIYGDDALFLKADILQNNLDRGDEALDIYRQILFDYPGSIFNAEARKRFRVLRGDYQ